MTESANSTRLEIAQQFLTHLGHRDHARAIELVSPQVTYRVLGHHSLAGTFSGPDEVTNHLVNLVERTMGTFDAFKWEDWMVGEHHVAAIADIHMRADARAFAGRVLFLVKFDVADKVAHFTVFFEDQDSALRFFGP